MRFAAQDRYSRLKEENDRLIESDLREKRVRLRGMPSVVCLATDATCNLKCIMCFRSADHYEEIAEPIEERLLVKFAEEVFPTARTLQLNIAGEPFLSRHVDLELALATEFGLKLDIATNGTLLPRTGHRLEQLAAQTQSITFSIDSPVKETYESIRKRARFEQTVENVRLFQKARNLLPEGQRPHASINMVLMRRNLGELPRMLGFCKEMGVEHLAVSWLIAHSSAMEAEALSGSDQGVRQALSDAQRLARELDVSLSLPPLTEEGDTGGSTAPPKTCPFLWRRVYIDMEANIVPCCSPAHIVAGNVGESTFREIWNGEFYARMRSTFAGGIPFDTCYECATSGYLSKISL